MSVRPAKLRFAVLVIWMCAVGPACKGGDDVTWPAQPADGSPVAMEFLGLEGEGKEAKARVRFFNFSDKDVRGIQVRLLYLDASGKEIDTFPWSQMANPRLIGSKSHVVKRVGAFMKPGTVSVGVRFREVEFTDGSRWLMQGEGGVTTGP